MKGGEIYAVRDEGSSIQKIKEGKLKFSLYL